MNGPGQTSVPKSGADGWWTARRFLLLLVVAVFAVFPKVTLGLTTFFYRDFGALGYPGTIFFRASLFHGELPLWNPYSHCGVPFLAQMGAWYLPSWLCLFLPLPWAVNFFMLLHLVFGGAGMFWLARRWGAGNFAAAFAGFAFVFNGISLSCLLWPNYIAALGWLPWVVGSVMAAWKSGGRWLVLAAVAGALQVLTATPELTLLTWVFLGAVWFVDVLARKENAWLSAGRVVVVVALAAGITMVQMLPFFDLLQHSQRSDHAVEAAWAMPGWGWANLIVPFFHFYQSPQGTWFQTDQGFIASYYLGGGVLVLGIVGAGRMRSRLAAVVTGMVLFCWIMALGSSGFLYDWVHRVFPLIGIARFPVKFAVLPAFLLPLLAAWGIDRCGNPGDSGRRALGVVGAMTLLGMGWLLWFAGKYPLPWDEWNVTAWNTVWRVGAMLVLLGGIFLLPKLKGRAARQAVQLLLLLVLPVDAVTHSPGIAPTLPADALAPGVWQVSRPTPKLGAGRVMISQAAEWEFFYSQVKRHEFDFAGKRLAEWYNLNLLDGVPKVNGAFTLRPAQFDAVERYFYNTPTAHFGPGLLDFLSVAWFTSPTNFLEWSARTNFLPVLTAGQLPRFAALTPTWQGITAKDFDPRAVVYLPEAGRAAVTVSNRTVCVVSNARFSNNQITADVSAQAPSLVVLSQANYHWWQATVDGRPTRILTANLAFQALQVPAGKHQVKLVYRDSKLLVGAVISLLSLAVCGWIWLQAGRTPTRRP